MKKLFVIIAVFALFGLNARVTLGYLFLKPGLTAYGARANGMGGAFVAIADDGFAPYYNPAGMTQLKTPMITGDISLSEASEENFRIYSGFGGVTTSSWACNLYFDQKLGLEEPDEGTYYLVISEAAALSKSLSIGGNVKLSCDVSGKLDGDATVKGANIAIDLGGLLKPSDSTSYGVVVRNLSAPFRKMNGDTTYPWLTLGWAHKSSSTTYAADLDIIIYEWFPVPWPHFGIEEKIWDTVALRIGLSGLPGYFTVNGGCGIKIFGVNADIAYILQPGKYSEVEFSTSYRF